MPRWNCPRAILVTATSGSIRVWDCESWELSAGPIEVPKPIRHLEFSEDGKLIMAIGGEIAVANQLKVWEADSGDAVGPGIRFSGLGADHGSLSTDGTLVVAGGKNKKAAIWEVASGKKTTGDMKHGGWITQLRFSPDGHQVSKMGSGSAA